MCFERSIRHSIPDEMLEDTFGISGWKQLPDEVYKRVRVQPAVYTVEEHHVEVYAGKDNQTILKADRPKSLLRNSIVTPSLAAIMSYRQTKHPVTWQKTDVLQTVRVICGYTAPGKPTRTDRSFCMITNGRGKRNTHRNF